MDRLPPFLGAGMRTQRGAAALAVSMLLLFGMTALAFFTNRNMVFEQRTSANQYRSTTAFEVAEAGLEWAVARLNEESNLDVAPSCATAAAGAASYADRYLPYTDTEFTRYDPTVAAQRRLSACRIDGSGAVNCTCPAIGTAPSVGGSSTERRFLVAFLNGPADDKWTVRVQVVGCTDDAAACGDAAGTTADGTAVVSALYKMKPNIASKPGAGLVTGAATNVDGNLTVVNKDPASNGITIHSGSTVELSPATGASTEVYTLDGTPAAASILDNDPALRNLTNADVTGELFFKNFFQQGFDQYKTSSKTWMITSGSCAAYGTRCTSCASAGACGTAVTNAWATGFERFYADTNIEMNASNGSGASSDTFGSAQRPLSLVSTGAMDFRGTVTAYGMFYAATTTANFNYSTPGVGNATVYGAILSRGQFTKGTGTLKLIYDPNLFNPTKQRGTMVRVPGSWRDSANDL